MHFMQQRFCLILVILGSSRLGDASVDVPLYHKAYEGRNLRSEQLFMGVLMLDILLSDLIASKSDKVISPTEICNGVNVSGGAAKLLQVFEYLSFAASF